MALGLAERDLGLQMERMATELFSLLTLPSTVVKALCGAGSTPGFTG